MSKKEKDKSKDSEGLQEVIKRFLRGKGGGSCCKVVIEEAEEEKKIEDKAETSRKK